MREGLILNLKSNSSDILRWIWASCLLVAMYFSSAITSNVAKNRLLKEVSGWFGSDRLYAWSQWAGAENNHSRSRPSSFYQELFEMYATGNYSLQTLRKSLSSSDCAVKRGATCYFSDQQDFEEAILLWNDGYKYGVVEHAYETLISKALFQQVQDVINGYHKTPHKMAIKPFIFKGLITCADCGVFALLRFTKALVYYSCTNAKKVCKRVMWKKRHCWDLVELHWIKLL